MKHFTSIICTLVLSVMMISVAVAKPLPPQIQVKMTKDQSNWDLAWLEFNSSSSMGYNPAEDAMKFMNSVVNVGFYISNTVLLQFNSVPLSSAADTFIMFANAAPGNYSFDFTGISTNVPTSKNIYLLDMYTNGTLDLRATSSYTFAITSSSATSGNRFRIVINNVPLLPVEWLSFEASAAGADAKLEWATATEKNNSHFVIERSSGAGYEEAGIVEGQRNTVSVSSYGFTDRNVFTAGVDRVSYRLKQLDKDGRYSYSNEITVQSSRPAAVGTISLFPNPATSVMNVRVENLSDIAGTEVVDMKGNVIPMTCHAGSIDIEGLQSGIYILRITPANGEVLTARFTKR